ncbi:hydroxyacid-oxoacid transhydrogenase [Pseudogracilibacillus sp. SE30717A]|uniref:hydroxyacid-oxoacid transhydrogenase n=1 Tax=Pseudogracilibacillus sp. SE30717A TaxID=3098293 RepID=UPI00300E4513
MRSTWEFITPQRIVFGNGSLNKLDSILQDLDAKNVLLVTDEGIKKAGIAGQVEQMLLDRGYKLVIYDEVEPEPSTKSILQGYEYVKGQMDTDAVIALGGGSSIDTAKIISLLIAHGGHPLDYYGGENKVPGPISPLIAIPTTAGTGSEVTSVAVITDENNDLKVGISDNQLRATVALIDPELTLGLPPYITACSGIDALAHAIEAYTAKSFKYIEAGEKIVFQGSFPLGDTFAFQAIELIANNLRLAVQQGNNLDARSNMLLGSLLAGLAFSNAGTAAAHALAYPIGALTSSPHGEVTGLLLPYVMQYNTSVEIEKMVKIASAFGVNVNNLTTKEAANAAHKSVLELIDDIGLPTRLSSIGIKESDISVIAQKGLEIDRLIRNNPRDPKLEDFKSLLAKAL